MSESPFLSQVFEDTLFAIVNTLDNTKRVILNLASATTGKTLTLESRVTDNRTIKFPDKSGTLETLESNREAVLSLVVDYSAVEIGYMDLCCSGTLTLENPVQGKSMMLEVKASGHYLSFPPSVRIIGGKFKADTVNYIYFHCINGVTPTYLVTIGQQVA